MIISIAAAVFVALTGLTLAIIAMHGPDSTPKASSEGARSNKQTAALQPQTPPAENVTVADDQAQTLTNKTSPPHDATPAARPPVDEARWRLTQIDDPAGIPPRLVAILGDGRFRDVESSIRNVRVTKDRKLLVTRGVSSVRVWSLPEGRLVYDWPLPRVTKKESFYAQHLAMDAEETTLAAVHLGEVYRFNIRTGESQPVVKLARERASSVVFSPDLSRCAFTEPTYGGTVGRLEHDDFLPSISRGRFLHPIALLEDGKTVISYEPTDNEMRAVDVASGSTIWKAPVSNPGRLTRGGAIGPYYAKFSTDSRRLTVFELAGGKLKWTSTFSDAKEFAASLDGRFISLLDEISPNQMRVIVHDLKDDRQIINRSLAELWGIAAIPEKAAMNSAMSADGSLLVLWSHQLGLCVLEVPSGAVLVKSDSRPIEDVAFSVDESALATVDMLGYATVWDVATARQQCMIRAGQPLDKVRFTPDGRSLQVLEKSAGPAATDSREQDWDGFGAKIIQFNLNSDNRSVIGQQQVQGMASQRGSPQARLYGTERGAHFLSFGGTLSVLDATTHSSLQTIPDARTPCATSPNNKMAVAVGDGKRAGALIVSNLEEKREMHAFRHASAGAHPANSYRVLTVNDEGVVRTIDPSVPQILQFAGGVEDAVKIPLFSSKFTREPRSWKSRLALSPSGSYLAIPLDNGLTLLFDVKTPPPSTTELAKSDSSPRREKKSGGVPTTRKSPVDSAKWRLTQINDPVGPPSQLITILGDAQFRSPELGSQNAYATKDRKLLVTTSATSVRVWSLPAGELIHEWRLPPLLNKNRTIGSGGELTFNDEETIAVMVQVNKLFRFDIRSGKRLPDVELTPPPTGLGGTSSLPYGVKFSEDLAVCAFTKNHDSTTVGRIEGDRFVPIITDRKEWYPRALINKGRTLICGRTLEDWQSIDIESPPPARADAPRRERPSEGRLETYHVWPYVGLRERTDSSLKLFDLRTGKWGRTLKYGVFGIGCASPDGRFLAAIAGRGRNEPETLVIHDVKKDKRILEQTVAELWGVTDLPKGPELDLRFASDGSFLQISSRKLGFRLLEMPSGRAVLSSDSSPIGQSVFSLDESSLVTVNALGQACVWNVPGGELRYRLETTKPVRLARFSPDGRFVFALSDGINCFDARTGKHVKRLPGDLSPQTDDFAIAADNESVLLHGQKIANRGEEKIRFERGAHSPDGSFFFRTSGDSVTVINTATGESVFKLANSRTPCATSPDRKLVAISGFNSDVSNLVIANLETKQEVHVFKDVAALGHGRHLIGPSKQLVISNDGMIRAPDGRVPQILQFNTQTQEESAMPLFSPGFMEDKENLRGLGVDLISPQGSYAIIGLRDGALLLFDVKLTKRD